MTKAQPRDRVAFHPQGLQRLAGILALGTMVGSGFTTCWMDGWRDGWVLLTVGLAMDWCKTVEDLDFNI